MEKGFPNMIDPLEADSFMFLYLLVIPCHYPLCAYIFSVRIKLCLNSLISFGICGQCEKLFERGVSLVACPLRARNCEA